jgi:hypothetical protein
VVPVATLWDWSDAECEHPCAERSTEIVEKSQAGKPVSGSGPEPGADKVAGEYQYSPEHKKRADAGLQLTAAGQGENGEPDAVMR